MENPRAKFGKDNRDEERARDGNNRRRILGFERFRRKNGFIEATTNASRSVTGKIGERHRACVSRLVSPYALVPSSLNDLERSRATRFVTAGKRKCKRIVMKKRKTGQGRGVLSTKGPMTIIGGKIFQPACFTYVSYTTNGG